MSTKVKPCYRVAHNRTFLEKQVWVWILRDIKGRPSHKYRNAGDRFECNRSFSVFGGSSQKSAALLWFRHLHCAIPDDSVQDLCQRGGAWSPAQLFWITKRKKKKKARWLMFVCVISGVTSSDMDASTSNTLQAGASIDWKIYCGSWLFLFLSLFFDILPFLVLNSAISVSQGNKQETKYWKVEQEKLSVPLSGSLVSWVTVLRTRAGCSGVLSLWCCWHSSRAVS